MAVTIYDIAREVGTTHATVSRALRDDRTIASATRTRVKRAARRMGYRPNLLARGLSGGRTHTVGVIWALAGPHVADIMARSIAVRAQRHGCITYVVDGMMDVGAIERTLADFALRRVDAVVVEWGWRDDVRTEFEAGLRGFPAAVVVTRRPMTVPVDHVVHDRTPAFRAVADHFAKTGRRRPGIVMPVASGRSKLEAFATRLKEHGIELGDDQIIDLDLGRDPSDRRWGQACYEALDARFPTGRPGLDALMCSADEIAVAAMAWLRAKGLRTPRDVAVVGFNDNQGSEFLDTPLASVARRNKEAADAVERMLFARLEDPDLPIQREYIPMQFVWRESAG